MSETTVQAPACRFVIPVYPGTTHLDFTAPHQFFSRVPGATVTVASASGGQLELDGLTFAGVGRLADIADCDVLCVPGGFGAVDAIHDAAFLDEIRRLGGRARYVTSVCTGSIILAAAGLLEGRRAACHWYWRDMLARFPGVTVDPARVVRDGNVITGGGVTAGIDLALTVIAEIAGEALAQSIQLGLEYAPQPPFDAGRPDCAPTDTVSRMRETLSARTVDQWQKMETFLAAMPQ